MAIGSEAAIQARSIIRRFRKQETIRFRTSAYQFLIDEQVTTSTSFQNILHVIALVKQQSIACPSGFIHRLRRSALVQLSLKTL